MMVKPAEHWGHACYRTDYADDGEWQGFKEKMLYDSGLGLLRVNTPGNIRECWRLHFIEDRFWLEGASVDTLRWHVSQWMGIAVSTLLMMHLATSRVKPPKP